MICSIMLKKTYMNFRILILSILCMGYTAAQARSSNISAGAGLGAQSSSAPTISPGARSPNPSYGSANTGQSAGASLGTVGGAYSSNINPGANINGRPPSSFRDYRNTPDNPELPTNSFEDTRRLYGFREGYGVRTRGRPVNPFNNTGVNRTSYSSSKISPGASLGTSGVNSSNISPGARLNRANPSEQTNISPGAGAPQANPPSSNIDPGANLGASRNPKKQKALKKEFREDMKTLNENANINDQGKFTNLDLDRKF